jgi:hypothetical protein
LAPAAATAAADHSEKPSTLKAGLAKPKTATSPSQIKSTEIIPPPLIIASI